MSVNQETGSDGMISLSYSPKCDYRLEFQTYQVRVDITIDGITYFDDTRVPDNGSGILEQKKVTIIQRNHNDISIGRFGKKTEDNFLNYTSPFTFYYPTNIQNDVFRATQSITSNEKYSHWENISDIVNHKSLSFNQSQQTFYAQLNTIGNATVKINSPECPSMQLKFIDPWLINDFSDPLGTRNKGMNADTLSLQNIDNNLAISSEHQGVLLNQEISSNKPYYTIGIPSSINFPQNGGLHNIYLQSWNVSGASLQYPNSLTTGVIFTSSSGANITANVKATQLTNNSNAFANNSQRKLIKTPDGVMHLVYESMGRVWYETSTNNGQTWQLMNGGRPLDNGAGKCPAIDYSYNAVAIVYQQQNGSNYTIQLKAFLPVNGQYVYNYGTTLYWESGASYSTSNASPVIGWASSSKLVLVWKGVSSLKYVFGDLAVNPYYSSTFTYYGSGDINGSTSYSYSPSIAVDKVYTGSINKYALVWEQVFGSTAAIYYSPISIVYGPAPPSPPLEIQSSDLVQPDVIGTWYLMYWFSGNRNFVLAK